VNVGGLENVLKAAKRTPEVKKIVYTSSYFAIGPTDGYVADEKQVQTRFRIFVSQTSTAVALHEYNNEHMYMLV